MSQAGAHGPSLLILLIPLAIIVAVVHWPSLSAEAVSFDDTQYVTENRLVLNPSWDNAVRFLREITAPSTVRGYYQPLTMISLMVDCALGASLDNFVPFHRTSLALHVCNALLVAILLHLLFSNAWAAAIAALIWGLHPLTIEPIPWISERKTLLAAFFALLSLISYVRWCRGRSVGWMAAACTFLFLALMSKPTTTPLPVLMVLLDIWPMRRFALRTLLEKIPLFALSGLFAIITIISQGSTAHMSMPGQHDPSRIIYITAHNIVFYLHKFLLPHDLTSHYPFPNPLSPASTAIMLGLILTPVILANLLISLRWTRGLVVGWLFFFICIFPTLGIIGFTNVIASDKYAYLPMIGFMLPVAALLAGRWPQSALQLKKPRYALIVAIVLAVCIAEAVAVRRQLAYWQTTESLFERMIALAPQAPTLHNNYGVYLYAEGKKDKAFEHYSEALRLSPEYADANRNVGMILSERNKVAEAIEHYRVAIERMTSAVDSRPRALVHVDLAIALRKLGKAEESIEHCREALRLDPACSTAYVSMGNSLRVVGRPAEAIEAYREALKIKPGDAASHNNLGAALADMKRYDEAIVEYKKAAELKANYAEPLANMALSLEALKRPEEAMAAYELAVQVEPSSVNARMKLAEARRKLGRKDEALAQFLKIIELNPAETMARRNAAFHLQEAGKDREAIEQYRAILRLEPNDSESRKNLAILLQRVGDLDTALQEAREAVRLSPDHVESRYTYAWLLEQKGMRSEASAEYQKVLELDPGYYKARLRLDAASRPAD